MNGYAPNYSATEDSGNARLGSGLLAKKGEAMPAVDANAHEGVDIDLHPLKPANSPGAPKNIDEQSIVSLKRKMAARKKRLAAKRAGKVVRLVKPSQLSKAPIDLEPAMRAQALNDSDADFQAAPSSARPKLRRRSPATDSDAPIIDAEPAPVTPSIDDEGPSPAVRFSPIEPAPIDAPYENIDPQDDVSQAETTSLAEPQANDQSGRGFDLSPPASSSGLDDDGEAESRLTDAFKHQESQPEIGDDQGHDEQPAMIGRDAEETSSQGELSDPFSGADFPDDAGEHLREVPDDARDDPDASLATREEAVASQPDAWTAPTPVSRPTQPDASPAAPEKAQKGSPMAVVKFKMPAREFVRLRAAARDLEMPGQSVIMEALECYLEANEIPAISDEEYEQEMARLRDVVKKRKALRG